MDKFSAEASGEWIYKGGNEDFQKLFELLLKGMWSALSISHDIDFQSYNKKLTVSEQAILKITIAEFLLFDSRIQRQLVSQFIDNITNSQISGIYTAQALQEVIHEQSYELQFKAICPYEDPSNVIANNSIFNDKIDWYNTNMLVQQHSSQILVNAIVEYLFFCGKFALIYWFKTNPKGGPPGIIAANEYIARDENNHVKNAITYYHYYNQPLDVEIVRKLIMEACELEIKSINQTYPKDLEHIDATRMSNYVRYSANDLYQSITKTNKVLYDNVKNNPCPWMEAMKFGMKSSFFEVHTSNYKNEALEHTLDTEFDI